jgi:putative hemolysin
LNTSIALLITLLALSAFSSSSETAFFSLNRFQLRRIRERYRGAFDRIQVLLRRPSRLLVLILLINELTNISVSTLVTELVDRYSPLVFQRWPLVESYLSDENTRWFATAVASVFLTLPIVLIFGEITPKVIASKMSRLVAISNSLPLMFFYRLLHPVLWSFDYVIGLFLRRFKSQGKDYLSKTMSVLSEEDFVLLMEEGHREGTVKPIEKRLIENVLEFDDSKVADVMTPIHQGFCISATDTVAQVLPEIRSQKYSRIPVYQRQRKKLVGILYVKDLLALHRHPQMRDLEVKSLMTPPIYVGPDMKLSVLFRRFKESKTHMAICVNQEEDALGVVTMEDVLESIFGEIEDERDVK